MNPSTSPYRRIVEHLPDGIVFLYEEDDELRYTFVDGEGLEGVDLSKEDLEGHVVSEDRPPEVKDRIHRQYRRALDGEEVRFDVEAEGRHFRFKLAPVRDEAGAIAAGIGIARDVTEQVVYRKELERQNERLQQFTSLVFHDIRNPLNVAQGRLDLLREECDSEQIEPIADALARIESLTGEDTALIDDRTVETSDAVGIDAVATAAWRNVSTKSIALRVDAERTVRANENDLRRMFENLFRNAAEHGGDSATVTVGDLDTGFYVEDDGVGIPAEDRAIVFERGISNSDRGTGLGLFIVESVVEGHGWTIDVTDGEEGGARFEITGVDGPS